MQCPGALIVSPRKIEIQPAPGKGRFGGLDPGFMYRILTAGPEIDQLALRLKPFAFGVYRCQTGSQLSLPELCFAIIDPDQRVARLDGLSGDNMQAGDETRYPAADRDDVGADAGIVDIDMGKPVVDPVAKYIESSDGRRQSGEDAQLAADPLPRRPPDRIGQLFSMFRGLAVQRDLLPAALSRRHAIFASLSRLSAAPSRGVVSRSIASSYGINNKQVLEMV